MYCHVGSMQCTVLRWFKSRMSHISKTCTDLHDPHAWKMARRNGSGEWPKLNETGHCCFIFMYTSCGFYPRDAMLARVIAIATCLSLRLSVTRRYCVKTKKASGMISSPSGSPKTLVFWRQTSSPNSKGFPPNGASNKGRSEKFSDFLPLSVNISKTVADTAKVTISH